MAKTINYTWIPGPITGIIGPQRSGKTFAALKLALQTAEELEYDLCFNFYINPLGLYKYLQYMGYTWLISRLINGNLYMKHSNPLPEFMERERTLYLMDEAGIYLNSRNFKDAGRQEFLEDLAQVGHKRRLLWWMAQYSDMVDRVLRDLTISFLQTDSYCKFNKEMGNTEILLQKFFLYEQRNYKIYLSKVEEKFRGIKHIFQQNKLALKSWIEPLSYADKLIFDIYKSFDYMVGEDLKEVKEIIIGKEEFKNFRNYKKVTFHDLSDNIENSKKADIIDNNHNNLMDNLIQFI